MNNTRNVHSIYYYVLCAAAIQLQSTQYSVRYFVNNEPPSPSTHAHVASFGLFKSSIISETSSCKPKTASCKRGLKSHICIECPAVTRLAEAVPNSEGSPPFQSVCGCKPSNLLMKIGLRTR